jgi:hypothetical protein
MLALATRPFVRAPESALRSLASPALLTLLVVGPACSSDPPTLTPGNNNLMSEDAGLCEEGATQECYCDTTPGESECSGGSWGDCDCSGFQGDGDGDGDGDKPNGSMNCKPGYYTGNFKGDWKPGIGDLGPIQLIEVTITGSDKPEKPGLALTLEEGAAPDPNDEFPTYEVKNGCLVGTASSGPGQNHPFIATITGSLSCETGEFEGHVDGYYQLFGEFFGGLSTWTFAGSMTGKFDLGTTSIEEGTWDLREKQNTMPMGPGGKATWQAAWQAAEGPALPEECRKLLEEGAPGGTPDAGT